MVCANAGVDQSNIDHGDDEAALLLLVDPDASAAGLRRELAAHTGARVGVVISDSFNRPWRLGAVGIAAAAVVAMGEPAEGTPAAILGERLVEGQSVISSSPPYVKCDHAPPVGPPRECTTH